MCNPPRSSFGRSNLVRRQSIETDSTTRDIHPGPERGLYAASPGSSGRPSRLIHAWPAFVRGSGVNAALRSAAVFGDQEQRATRPGATTANTLVIVMIFCGVLSVLLVGSLAL